MRKTHKISGKDHKQAARIAASAIRACYEGMVLLADAGLLAALNELAVEMDKRGGVSSRDDIATMGASAMRPVKVEEELP